MEPSIYRSLEVTGKQLRGMRRCWTYRCTVHGLSGGYRELRLHFQTWHANREHLLTRYEFELLTMSARQRYKLSLSRARAQQQKGASQE